MTPNKPEYSWSLRRVCVFWAIALCSGILIKLVVNGADTRLNETLANGSFLLLAAVIGSYVFGAVWHDRGLMQLPVFGTRRRPRWDSDGEDRPTKFDNIEEPSE